MKIRIYTDKDKDGYVQYDPLTKNVMVTHDDEKVREKVSQYLHRIKRYTVSDKENNGRMYVKHSPIEATCWMEMALCEMFSTIGVHVDWSHEGNYRSNIIPPTAYVESPKADKPIVKSVDNRSSYEIIN